jgi:hypothetical protein
MKFEYFEKNNTVSIAIETENGRLRQAFVPGEIDKVIAFVGQPDLPEIQELRDRWTPEAIQAYQALLNPEPELDFKTEAGYLVEDYINIVAKQRGYRDAVSCSTYANSKKPTWKAEAIAFSDWRDDVWEFVINEFSLIETGQKPLPSLDEIIPSLPEMVWP